MLLTISPSLVLLLSNLVTEARCTPNGIGIVKLMGRASGYIAAHTTIASRQVDLCLIPEVPFDMDGPHGVLEYLEKVVRARGRAVIVVAEGAGEHVLKAINE
jgi:6-phosphofructokinase 1